MLIHCCLLRLVTHLLNSWPTLKAKSVSMTQNKTSDLCGMGTYLGSLWDPTQNLVVTTLVPQGKWRHGGGRAGGGECLNFTVMLLNKSLQDKNTAMALSLPNPWGKHSSLSSHSGHQYTYRRSPRRETSLAGFHGLCSDPTPHLHLHTYTLMLQFFWQLCPSICGEIAN